MCVRETETSCAQIDTCLYGYPCMWSRSAWDAVPQLLSNLLSETRSLTSLTWALLIRLDWLVNACSLISDLPASTFLATEIMMIPRPRFPWVPLGEELRSSCSHGFTNWIFIDHFINGVTSLAPSPYSWWPYTLIGCKQAPTQSLVCRLQCEDMDRAYLCAPTLVLRIEWHSISAEWLRRDGGDGSASRSLDWECAGLEAQWHLGCCWEKVYWILGDRGSLSLIDLGLFRRLASNQNEIPPFIFLVFGNLKGHNFWNRTNKNMIFTHLQYACIWICMIIFSSQLFAAVDSINF